MAVRYFPAHALDHNAGMTLSVW